MTVTCECGDVVPADHASPDLTPGIQLCPPCAIDSAVPCHICGTLAPVRLYGMDGRHPAVLLGVDEYTAVCHDCDSPPQEQP